MSRPQSVFAGTIMDGVVCECGWTASPDDYDTLREYVTAIESHEQGLVGLFPQRDSSLAEGHNVRRACNVSDTSDGFDE